MVLASQCSISCPRHSTDLWSRILVHTTHYSNCLLFTETNILHVFVTKRQLQWGLFVSCLSLKGKKQPSAHCFLLSLVHFLWQFWHHGLSVLTSCALAWTNYFTQFVFQGLGTLTPILKTNLKSNIITYIFIFSGVPPPRCILEIQFHKNNNIMLIQIQATFWDLGQGLAHSRTKEDLVQLSFLGSTVLHVETSNAQPFCLQIIPWD